MVDFGAWLDESYCIGEPMGSDGSTCIYEKGEEMDG